MSLTTTSIPLNNNQTHIKIVFKYRNELILNKTIQISSSYFYPNNNVDNKDGDLAPDTMMKEATSDVMKETKLKGIFKKTKTAIKKKVQFFGKDMVLVYEKGEIPEKTTLTQAIERITKFKEDKL